MTATATSTDPTPQTATLHRRCPVCGCDNAASEPSAYSQAPWRLKACTGCGFLYLENPPQTLALSEDLAWEKTFHAEEARRLVERPTRKRLARRLRATLLPARKDLDHYARQLFEPGPVLDVGCSEGRQLLSLGDRFTPFGIEIAREAARRCNERVAPLGGRVVHAPALEGLAELPADFFTGAILRSYLEHETEPGAVLQRLFRVLLPGGRALVKVPNYGCLMRRLAGAEWCGFRHPEHVNYFTRGSLERMAGEAGFRCRFLLAKSLPTSDNMTAVLERPR